MIGVIIGYDMPNNCPKGTQKIGGRKVFLADSLYLFNPRTMSFNFNECSAL